MYRTARLFRPSSLHLPVPPLRLTSSALSRPTSGGTFPNHDRLLPVRFVPLPRSVVRYASSSGKAAGEVASGGTAAAPEESPAIENQRAISGAGAEVS